MRLYWRGVDIEHIARLARLRLSDRERKKLKEEIGHILAHIDRLKEVDVSGTEPFTHPGDGLLPLRKDEPRPPMSPEKALRNAPERKGNSFAVPRVLGP